MEGDYEEKSVNKIFYDNDRRKTGMKSAFRLCFIYNSYKIACQERGCEITLSTEKEDFSFKMNERSSFMLKLTCGENFNYKL